MAITRVFKSGNSQAVRIPRGFQLDVTEVEIFRRNHDLVIRPRKADIVEAFELLTEMPDDFMQQGRQDSPPQEWDFEA